MEVDEEAAEVDEIALESCTKVEGQGLWHCHFPVLTVLLGEGESSSSRSDCWPTSVAFPPECLESFNALLVRILLFHYRHANCL